MDDLIFDAAREHFKKSIETKKSFLNNPEQMAILVNVVKFCVEAYRRGNKILIAGNGGSAADAQHFAGELVSRFNFDRPPLAAIALTTDTSILTAIGNDYGYEKIFSRQIEAIGQSGDVFIGITTSGKSTNILNAFKRAKECGLNTIGLFGASQIKSPEFVDFAINVPSSQTPLIQESHLSIEHIICSAIEIIIFGDGK
jgi:D-sedoheptulose 7-phosphate isomerase